MAHSVTASLAALVVIALLSQQAAATTKQKKTNSNGAIHLSNRRLLASSSGLPPASGLSADSPLSSPSPMSSPADPSLSSPQPQEATPENTSQLPPSELLPPQQSPPALLSPPADLPSPPPLSSPSPASAEQLSWPPSQAPVERPSLPPSPAPAEQPSSPLSPTTPPAQPSPPPLPPSPSPPPSPVPLRGGNCPDGQDFLVRNNLYRARHQAPPMIWSESLATASTAYAQQLANMGCQLTHSTGKGYGENLFMQQGYPKPNPSCLQAVMSWYSEARSYDFNAPQPFFDNWPKHVGHFTQLVWRSSASIGCGVGYKDVPIQFGNRTYAGGCKVVVCRYKVQGNVANDMAFLKNVLQNTSTIVL